MMKSVTIEQVLAWPACPAYMRTDLQQLCDGRLTAENITKLNISIRDKLWILLREEFIPASVLRLLACDFAERALFNARKALHEPHQCCWDALETARQYAKDQVPASALEAAWHAVCNEGYKFYPPELGMMRWQSSHPVAFAAVVAVQAVTQKEVEAWKAAWMSVEAAAHCAEWISTHEASHMSPYAAAFQASNTENNWQFEQLLSVLCIDK